MASYPVGGIPVVDKEKAPATTQVTPQTTSALQPNVGPAPRGVNPNDVIGDLENLQGLYNNQWQTQLDLVAANLKSQQAAAAGAAGDIAAQREQLLYGQKAGIRDINQGVEAGLEQANNDAFQRGIYRSGIRTENRAEVEREGAEALQDLKKQTQFALQGLASRASALRQQMAAAREAAAAQRQQVTSNAALGWQNTLINWAMAQGLTMEELQLMQAGQAQPVPGRGGGGGTQYE